MIRIMRTRWSIALALLLLEACNSAPEVVDFRGSVTHAVVAEAREFDCNSITVSVWVRLEQHCEPQVFVNRGARNELFTLYLYKGAVRMLVGTAKHFYSFAKAERPEVGKWTHYAGTSDGETIRLYRDGMLASEASIFLPPQRGIPTTDVDAPLYIGSEEPALNAVIGEMRDVRIFDRALTAREIAEVHGGRAVAESALLGVWGDVSGDRWDDVSGGGTPCAIRTTRDRAQGG